MAVPRCPSYNLKEQLDEAVSNESLEQEIMKGTGKGKAKAKACEKAKAKAKSKAKIAPAASDHVFSAD